MRNSIRNGLVGLVSIAPAVFPGCEERQEKIPTLNELLNNPPMKVEREEPATPTEGNSQRTNTQIAQNNREIFYENTFTNYTIQAGDSMGKIAREHGISPYSLMRANPQYDNPDLIYVGDTIRVPNKIDIGNPQESTYELIKGFEGLRLGVYEDVGRKAIGYGHNFESGENYQTINIEKAEELLRRDVAEVDQIIDSWVRVKLSREQYDALASFVFNFSEYDLAESTLLERLNLGDYVGAANEFPRWINIENQPNSALIQRRNQERALFLSGTNTQKQ